MSDFTYESKASGERRENYEWTRVWLDSARDEKTERVLYIGDSISAGILRIATRLAEGRLLFDGVASSKALDDPLLLDYARLFAKEEGYRSYVIFNNGLHGWHLDDESEYPALFETAVKRLLLDFPEAKLLIANTTSPENAERAARVEKRNEAAQRIARQYSLPVIDLHRVSVENPSLLSGDGVHFTEEGYVALAQEILSVISAI